MEACKQLKINSNVIKNNLSYLSQNAKNVAYPKFLQKFLEKKN